MLYKEILKKRFGGKKVLIMGLGLQGGGSGATRFFASCGSHLTITDLRKRSELLPSLEKLKGISFNSTFGRHKLSDFLKADYIFKNPAVAGSDSYLLKAKKKKIPVLTESSIFFDTFPKEKIIGITGTKGKSTTSALIYHCLKKKFKVALAGTPQTSALDILLLKNPPDYVVYELSSFALENLKQSPAHAVITSFFPDHLNRYKNIEKYWQAKENIFKWQRAGERLFLPKGDAFIKKLVLTQRKKDIVWFGPKNFYDFSPTQCVNGLNFGASREVLKLFGFKDPELKKCLFDFKNLEGRMEYVGRRQGVIFINDTTATNPMAASSSISEIKKFYRIDYRKIILISGGVDKNLPYGPLKPILPLLKHIVILPGTASKKLLPLLKRNSYEKAAGMEDAVDAAFAKSRGGDVILLSPAAASFNMFRNEFDRGRQFAKIVRKLKF